MNKFKKVFLSFIMIMFCLILPACGGKDDNSNNKQNSGANFEIVGATKKYINGVGDVYYLKVPNNQASINFSTYVKTGVSNWILSRDIEGNQVVNSKTVSLVEGDNPYYYIYTNNSKGAQQTYIVQVRRRTMINVHFNSNGGSNCDSVIVEEDGYLKNPPTSTKIGYSFAGWDFDFMNTPVTQSFTARANWNPNKYTITYNANGGIISKTSQDVYYNQSYELYEPTRNGYTFLGWKNNDNHTTSNSGVWNYDYDITLTASWEIENYSITYNLNGGIFE